MTNDDNQLYFQKIEEIGDKIYEFYKLSDRKDLIMQYNMQEDRIYSYVYKDFLMMLNPRSKKILKAQYKEAKKEGKIVLFIKDEAREKFKSFTI